jgi:acyl-CoA thioester hydrolase
MQVVYYANYFVWFEVGRCEWLRSLGRSYRDLEANGIQLPVIEAHCEYRRSARYDDDLTIVTRGHLLSPARVRFEYEVQRVTDNVVTAVGRTVHAAVNNTGRPTRLPMDVREMFA